jgi:hypothetical protein
MYFFITISIWECCKLDNSEEVFISIWESCKLYNSEGPSVKVH